MVFALNLIFLHWWNCTDLGLIDMFSANQNAEVLLVYYFILFFDSNQFSPFYRNQPDLLEWIRNPEEGTLGSWNSKHFLGDMAPHPSRSLHFCTHCVPKQPSFYPTYKSDRCQYNYDKDLTTIFKIGLHTSC